MTFALSAYQSALSRSHCVQRSVAAGCSSKQRPFYRDTAGEESPTYSVSLNLACQLLSEQVFHASHRLPEHASRSPSETREPDVLDPRGRRRRFALSSWKLLCFSQGLLGPPLPPAGCGQPGLSLLLSAKHPRGPTCPSRDSHRSRVGPSRPAWRVISAITSFGPQLPWGLLETGQERGLLPLRAPTPSVDRQSVAPH